MRKALAKHLVLFCENYPEDEGYRLGFWFCVDRVVYVGFVVNFLLWRLGFYLTRKPGSVGE